MSFLTDLRDKVEGMASVGDPLTEALSHYTGANKLYSKGEQRYSSTQNRKNLGIGAGATLAAMYGAPALYGMMGGADAGAAGDAALSAEGTGADVGTYTDMGIPGSTAEDAAGSVPAGAAAPSSAAASSAPTSLTDWAAQQEAGIAIPGQTGATSAAAGTGGSSFLPSWLTEGGITTPKVIGALGLLSAYNSYQNRKAAQAMSAQARADQQARQHQIDVNPITGNNNVDQFGRPIGTPPTLTPALGTPNFNPFVQQDPSQRLAFGPSPWQTAGQHADGGPITRGATMSPAMLSYDQWAGQNMGTGAYDDPSALENAYYSYVNNLGPQGQQTGLPPLDSPPDTSGSTPAPSPASIPLQRYLGTPNFNPFIAQSARDRTAFTPAVWQIQPAEHRVPLGSAQARGGRAGQGPLAMMAQGPGGGQADQIPAMLSDGEYVMDADTVSNLGDGSNNEGARRLDTMRTNIRKHKRSAPVGKIPPKAKAPEAYLKRR